LQRDLQTIGTALHFFSVIEGSDPTLFARAVAVFEGSCRDVTDVNPVMFHCGLFHFQIQTRYDCVRRPLSFAEGDFLEKEILARLFIAKHSVFVARKFGILRDKNFRVGEKVAV